MLHTTVRLDPLKFSLRATIDHHAPYIHSGHYIASIKCCKKSFYCNDHTITEFGIIDSKNSSTAYVISFMLCNWLSLRRLVSWFNHLPPVCCSTFWKTIFKHQLVCRFDILDSISSFFCIVTYPIIYVLIHHIIFWPYLYFLNILYFFNTPVQTSSIDIDFVLSILWVLLEYCGAIVRQQYNNGPFR